VADFVEAQVSEDLSARDRPNAASKRVRKDSP